MHIVKLQHIVKLMAFASFKTETWFAAHGDKAKTVELAPSIFDMKLFPRQLPSHCGGIATTYESYLGSNITLNTYFYFTHNMFKVVYASLPPEHMTTFFCLYHPTPNPQNNLTDSLFNEQLPDLDYIDNLSGLVCLVEEFWLCHFTMNEHVSIIAQTCYFKLCYLASIWLFLITSSLTLISAFALPKNSLL